MKSETTDRTCFSCLDVSVTAHAVDARRQAADVLTRLGEGTGGDGYVDQDNARRQAADVLTRLGEGTGGDGYVDQDKQ